MKRLYFILCFIVALGCAPIGMLGQDIEKIFSDKLDKYRSKYFQEKVYVHTDRSFYVTGDYVWLKLVTVEGTSNTPSTLSKVAYVEILSAGNDQVIQAKISLENGKGNAALFLPASLSSGNYTLRAYTRWMKNFSPELYFSKCISIVNTFKPLEPTSASKNPEIDLQFFPEGGDLIEGIKSKVAFRLVDQGGEGIAREGFVLNSRNDTISVFSPLKFGIGHFYFTPEKDESYYAIVRNLSGGFVKISFPDAKASGYGMHVSDNVDGKKISIQIKSSDATDNDPMYLLIHNRTRSLEVTSQRLVKGETSFDVEYEHLEEGITHITLFDSKLAPVCERLYFKQSVKELMIGVSVNATKYFPRRRMIVEVDTRSLNTAVPADLSISAYRLDTLQQEDPLNVQNYLLLTSDLTGTIESPGYYFSKDKDVVQAADNLMLTHGWRRFQWEQVLQSQPIKLDFIPEYRGHIIEGTVNHLTTGEIGTNIPSYLAIAGKQFHFRGSKSSRDGKVYFEMGDFFGERQLIVQTNPTIDSMFTTKINDPFSSSFSSFKNTELTLSGNVKNELLKRSINMQMANAYYDSEQASRIPFQADSIPFFGSADSHYRLDDYTRFPVMEEVMREYVPSVFVRKRKGNFHFMIVDKITNELLRNDPLVLLDGVPIFDTDKVMEIDPLLIQELDVVAKRYFYGSLSFDGIVSYTTYGKESFEFPISANSLVTNYSGMEYQRQFFSPVYETKEQKSNRIPDFRDLLYWSPSIVTDENGKANISFYTSDQTGSYVLNIQGLTDEGVTGSTSYRFEVEIDNN